MATSLAVDPLRQWADRGSCVDRPEVFYNDEHDSKGHRRQKEKLATDMCDRCPVLAQCRRYAIEARELYGVWGGLTEMQRHTLAGRQRTG